MPRKPKVTVIPVEQDPKTDAEQMTHIINEVGATEPVLLTENEQPNALTTPVAPKRRQSERLRAAQACPSQKKSIPKWWALLP